MSNTSKTDWAKVDALDDRSIDTSDIPPLGKSFFAKAKLRTPQKAEKMELEVDSEVAEWFRSKGPDLQRLARAALRIYAEAHQLSSN